MDCLKYFSNRPFCNRFFLDLKIFHSFISKLKILRLLFGKIKSTSFLIIELIILENASLLLFLVKKKAMSLQILFIFFLPLRNCKLLLIKTVILLILILINIKLHWVDLGDRLYLISDKKVLLERYRLVNRFKCLVLANFLSRSKVP